MQIKIEPFRHPVTVDPQYAGKEKEFASNLSPVHPTASSTGLTPTAFFPPCRQDVEGARGEAVSGCNGGLAPEQRSACCVGATVCTRPNRTHAGKQLTDRQCIALHGVHRKSRLGGDRGGREGEKRTRVPVWVLSALQSSGALVLRAPPGRGVRRHPGAPRIDVRDRHDGCKGFCSGTESWARTELAQTHAPGSSSKSFVGANRRAGCHSGDPQPKCQWAQL